MKASVTQQFDLPGPPDAFSFAKAAIEDIVRTYVALCPITLATSGIVAAFNQEAANVVVAVARHIAPREIQAQVHPMAVARTVVIETDPGARWEEFVAHNPIESAV
jgi:hypothetical protein